MARGTNENYSYGKILLRKYYATWFRPIFLLACLNYRVICHTIGKDT